MPSKTCSRASWARSRTKSCPPSSTSSLLPCPSWDPHRSSWSGGTSSSTPSSKVHPSRTSPPIVHASSSCAPWPQRPQPHTRTSRRQWQFGRRPLQGPPMHPNQRKPLPSLPQALDGPARLPILHPPPCQLPLHPRVNHSAAPLSPHHPPPQADPPRSVRVKTPSAASHSASSTSTSPKRRTKASSSAPKMRARAEAALPTSPSRAT